LLVSGVFAGRIHDHGLLDDKAHAAGVMLAVVVVGRPLTVNVTATGKVAPPSGSIASE
jgi:hypothetical protein